MCPAFAGMAIIGLFGCRSNISRSALSRCSERIPRSQLFGAKRRSRRIGAAGHASMGMPRYASPAISIGVMLMRKFLTFIIVFSLYASVQAEDKPPIVNRTLKLSPSTATAPKPATVPTSNKTRTAAMARTVQPLRFKPVTAVQIKKPVAIKLEKLKPIRPAAKPTQPRGPDPAATLDLSDVIDDPSLLEDLGLVCGWDSHLIIQDTAAAHVFYYIPRAFLLKRDPDGYHLSVQYNARAEAGQPSVMITAEMEAPHRFGDVHLLKAILRQALDLKSTDPLEIKALPGLGATADLQALATGLTLPPERIHLTPPAHLKQVFRLTLSLTQDETEEVLAQISRDGLVGSLNVKVKDTFIPIPIRLQYEQFSGPQLEGFEQWARGKTIASLENVTDFPVSIEAINAYRLHNGRLERISKSLKPVSIEPGATKPFKLPAAEKLLGKNLTVTWMGLYLDGSCGDCVKNIDLRVRKGVGLAPGSRIHLEAIPSAFEEFGLYKLIVHLQSPYFTAEGTTLQQREVALTAEENENEDIMIFVPTGKGTDPLLYKYRLEAITETGETRLTPQWEDARKLTQFFGTSQLEVLFNAATDGSSTE